MKKRTPPRPRLALVASDEHVNSTVGLWPPGFVTDEGNPVGQNAWQEWVWADWLNKAALVRQVIAGDPFVFINNGDMVEGYHHRSKEFLVPEPGDQLRAAEEVLKPMCAGASAIYIVRGTDCHVGRDEIAIGRHLGAVADPDTGLHAFLRLRIEIAGTLCEFSHHVSTSTVPWTGSTGPTSKMYAGIIECVKAGHRVPRVYGSAHRHKHGEVCDGHFMSFVTSASQGLTTHGHKVVPTAVPTPSVVLLDWRGLPDDSLPVLHRFVTPAPEQTTVKA